MKPNRREFLTLAAMAVAGTHPSCAYLITPRKQTNTEHLEIRDGYTHPLTQISRAQGEEEIAQLTNSTHTQKEENWLHQGVTNDDHSRWHDISVEQELCTSRIDYNYVKRVVKGSEFITKYSGKKLRYTWYHMHPITTLEARFKQAIIKIKDTTEAEIDVEMTIPEEWVIEPEKIELLAMPSTGDILTHIELDKFLRKYGFELEPTKLVMPTGTYTFKPGNKIIRLYNKRQRELVEHMRVQTFCAGLGLSLPDYREHQKWKRRRRTPTQIMRDAETSLENMARDANIGPALHYLRESGLEIEYKKKRNIPDVIARL